MGYINGLITEGEEYKLSMSASPNKNDRAKYF